MRVIAFGIGALANLAGCQLLFDVSAPDEAVKCAFGSSIPPFTSDFAAGTSVDWGTSFETAGNLRIEGVLELQLDQTVGCVGITSVPFDACGVDLSIHVLAAPTESATNSAFTLANGNEDIVDFFLEDNTLKLSGGTLPFTSEVEWWRFRVGPSIDLQTSSNGLDWTTRSTSALLPALDAATIEIGACNDLPVGRPRRFDSMINLTP